MRWTLALAAVLFFGALAPAHAKIQNAAAADPAPGTYLVLGGIFLVASMTGRRNRSR